MNFWKTRLDRVKLNYFSARRIWLFALLGLLGLLAFAGIPQGVKAQGGATLVVDAPNHVDVGQPILLKLTVRNAGDIAGYEAHLLFDTNAATFSGVHQRQNDVQQQGRDVVPVTVAEMTDGAAFGIASCPLADCWQGGGQKQLTGARGNVQLATASVTPLQAGTLEIRFDAVKFVDAAGNPVAVANATPDLRIQVGSGGGSFGAPPSRWQLPAGAGNRSSTLDVTRDRRVTIADVMEVALGWQTTHEAGTPCGNLPDAALDLNQDHCLDIADVQIAAANAANTAGNTPNVTTTPLTFTVNTTNDSADSTPGDGKCNAAGGCTLRAAIDEANLHPGPDTINFNIPGTGVQTINLKTNLPTLSDTSGGTTINGYTQPGAAANTSAQQSNAAIKIQLVGQGASAFDAFRISSANNVVKGLALYNLRRPFYLFGAGATGNWIVGDFIGTNAAATFGMTATVVNANGVHLENGAANNHIGSPTLADRNVISGNSRTGIATYFQGTRGNLFQNNIIGLSPLGDRKIPNLAHGVDINDDSASNQIGGTGANQRNVISGNGDPASTNYYASVEISHGSGTVQNKVLGNCMGTDLTCNTGPAYAQPSHYGVRLEDTVNNNEVAYNVIVNTRQGGINIDNYNTVNNRVHDNKIGITANGTASPNAFFGVRVKYHAQHNVIGPNNVIANNPTGVIIEYLDDDYNTITRNSIYNNTKMGIDLGPHFGVTYNDAGDTDAGANQELNFPVISSATTTTVKGTACGAAVVVKPCTIELFKAAPLASDLSGGQYGQGRTLVGTGSASGSFSITVSGVVVGDALTATATDAQGNTSEFSKNFKVTTVASGGSVATWHSVANANASGGAYELSAQANDTVRFHFAGRAVQWLTRTGPRMGMARVVIDGVDKGVIDLYSASPSNNVVNAFRELGKGKHVIEIVVLGTQNPAAKGQGVAVDAFVVGGVTTQESDPAIKYSP
jgi:CSLREA domain-containing protein